MAAERRGAALGAIALKDGHGKATEYSSCDVWRFENGRMAELTDAVIALSRIHAEDLPRMTRMTANFREVESNVAASRPDHRLVKDHFSSSVFAAIGVIRGQLNDRR
ncbi:MAG TPA: hypothetical protein VEA63_04000 [Opitutus sp.]|nr:hypothetical protein [Opitutus sp.]